MLGRKALIGLKEREKAGARLGKSKKREKSKKEGVSKRLTRLSSRRPLCPL